MAITCTIGKDGRRYYYRDGRRISAKEALAENPNIKCQSKSRRTAPKSKSRTKPKTKVSGCPGLRKTMDPKCEDQAGCEWVVGKGCTSSSKSPKKSPKKKTPKKSPKKKTPKKSPKKKTPKKSPKKKTPKKSPKKKGKYKPCLPHQYRDPKTNRCRNKPGYEREREEQGKYKPCPPHQVRDPVTHRCRNKPDFEREREKKRERPEYEKTPPGWRPESHPQALNCIDRSKLKLRPHQLKVVRYMEKHDGLLVVHGTGTGKTLTAVTLSQCYLDDNPRNKVVFVGPASLVTNFQKELRKYGVAKETTIKEGKIAWKRYVFYSFDAFYNLTKRLSRGGPEKGRPWPTKAVDLHNRMLIVDEAHNLRNSKSGKSRALVAAAETADKRVLLTATPFVNSLTDFIPLINIVYGKEVIGTPKQFYQNEVPDFLGNDLSPENMRTFRSLLRGKVDVVDARDPAFFPKQIDKVVEVNMTHEYYKKYERLIRGDPVFGLFFKHPNAFFNAYRKAVNKVGEGKYYSMKIDKAVPILEKGRSIIFTNWIDFGIKPIADALKKRGISYRIFTGSTPVKERQQIVNDFNAGEFQVLLLTKAGGEGLDLHRVKSVVVMDPTWNNAALQQIVGRAVRFESHKGMGKDAVVHVYFLVLVTPKGVKDPVRSGDQILYNIIKQKNKNSKALLTELVRMSI